MNTQVTNLKSLFLEQLRDRYDAAKQQQSAYPKLRDAVSYSQLAEFIQQDIKANKAHVRNLEQIFTTLGETAEGEVCEGTQGLIHEAVELLGYASQGDVLDIAIVASIQHVNHHDIAGYRSCQLLAEAIGEADIASSLAAMLADEKLTDAALEDAMKKLLLSA